MFTFTTVIPNIYNKQGINIIKANKIGNNTVQQNDINWSKRILGNEALTHMKTKIIIPDLTPKAKPYSNPSIKGLEYNKLSLCTLFI